MWEALPFASGRKDKSLLVIVLCNLIELLGTDRPERKELIENFHILIEENNISSDLIKKVLENVDTKIKIIQEIWCSIEKLRYELETQYEDIIPNFNVDFYCIKLMFKMTMNY